MSRFRLVTARRNSQATIAMTMADQWTYEGVTYYFNKAIPIGEFASGRPFTWTDPTAQLIATDPPSELVAAPTYQQETPSATISGQSYAANGLMVDPKMPIYNQRRDPRVDSSYKQGFDGLLGTNVVNGSSSTSVHEYDATLNKDPAIAGPLTLSSEMAMVKSVRITGLTGPPTSPTYSGWNYFERFSVFYVIDEQAVPEGAFAPPISGPDKVIRYKLSDVDRDVLPGGGLPVEMPSFATVVSEGYFDRGVQPFFMQSGEWMRRYIIVTKLGAFNGYSRDVGLTWSDYMAALLSEGSTASDAEVARAVQFGIDQFGCYDSGFKGLQGAGQAAGFIQFMFLAALMLHGVDDTLLTKALDTWSDPTHQHSWTNASLIGAAVAFDGNHDHNHITYFDEHVTTPPRPVWKHTGTGSWPDTPSAYTNADQDQDYETSSAGVANFPEILNLGRMMMPWLGQTFARYMNGGATTWDAPTERAAMFAYADRFLTFVRDYTGANLPNPVFSDSGNSTVTSRHRKYWDHIRTALDLDKWTGVPDAATPNNQTGYNRTPSFLTATADGFSWNLTNLGNDGGLPITGVRIWYSIDDGASWHLCDTQALTGTQTGRPPIKHWIRWQRQNAKGWGPITVNTKRKEDADNFERLSVTPTGSHSGTTTNTVAPKLVVPRYPRAWGPWYADAPATADLTDSITIYGSRGNWTGDLSAGFDLQHYRDGVAVPGQINAPYVLTTADLGTNHTHSVTVGGVSVTSSAVAIPSRPALATGVVCDIQALASDELFYEEVITSFRENSTNVGRRFTLTTGVVDNFDNGEVITAPGGKTGTLRVQLTATQMAVEEAFPFPFIAGDVITGATTGTTAEIASIAYGVGIDTNLYFAITGDDGEYVGERSLMGLKSSNAPTLRGNLGARVPLVPGDTYEGSITVGVGLGGFDAYGNTLLRIGSAKDAQDYLVQTTVATASAPNTSPGPRKASLYTVTIPPFVATTAACWVYLRTNTGTGGKAGGNPAVYRVSLNKVA